MLWCVFTPEKGLLADAVVANIRFHWSSQPYKIDDADRLMAVCTTPLALQYLTRPLMHQRVCGAASLAHLAHLDDRFVTHLADSTHLETLLRAVFEAATAPDDAALIIMPGGCSHVWHTSSLLSAAAHAARACHVAAPAAAAVELVQEDETRRKRPRFELDVNDVGVQHRDSTIFLIDAQPFYVHSIAMEKASPVLKQAMEAAGSSREPISLHLAIDAPADRHHALFGLAVEFAYTGAVLRLSDDDALPLYTLAEFLQIDTLRSYLVDTRLRYLMHADGEFAQRVWEAAMTFPALQEAAATAIVAHLSRPGVPGDNICSLLHRCHGASAAQPELTPTAADIQSLPWVVSLFSRTMRSALRARAAAAVAGAAGAA